MNFSRLALFGIVPLCLGACSGGSDQEETQSLAQEIVRGEVENGRPQVVHLTVETAGWEGWSEVWSCSGTYIAPRVVLTAAHCIPSTTQYTRVLVYHGNNYLEDYVSPVEVPPAGTDSPWALADSWETHPAWDASIVYPDLGIVYLDRQLPFEPLPMGLWRLQDRRIGDLGQVVGYGATKALSADIQENEGAGTKRSGWVPFLGSPARNPKPEDPHPGLDLPEVRAALAMFDGTDPLPNPCAGDSGGPVIMKQGRREYVFGVGSWTANWCEGFSYFTRLDPFVPYLMDALRRAGWAPLKPTLKCVSETPDGQLRAHFGYSNQNGIALHVPHGPHNALRADHPPVRPEDFKPGNHPWDFGVDFAPSERLTYLLKGRVGPQGVVRADAASARCDPNDLEFVANQFCEYVSPLGCSSNDECVTFQTGSLALDPDCLPVYADWLKCQATLPLEESFMCWDGVTLPMDYDSCWTPETDMCGI